METFSVDTPGTVDGLYAGKSVRVASVERNLFDFKVQGYPTYHLVAWAFFSDNFEFIDEPDGFLDSVRYNDDYRDARCFPLDVAEDICVVEGTVLQSALPRI